MRVTVTTLMFLLTTSRLSGADPSAAYWPEDSVRELLDKTQEVRLAPELDQLSPGERAAVETLLQAGEIIQRIYEDARHPEAVAAHEALAELHAAQPSERTADLLRLYRLFQGPIASTLDNQRVPFLPVAPQAVTRNIYPAGVTREEIDAFLTAHPSVRDSILGERTVVRRSTAANVARDIAALDRFPVLDTLHPGLRESITPASTAPLAFYAVPQSVAWADETIELHRLLNQAADQVERDDPEFARYLRNRSRDLLSDDYESGDAAWVSGDFRNLNAQIGSYETYDDPLYGVKAFHALSLLLRNREATARLREALSGGLQKYEDALPYERKKRVRAEIPVGVYEVIADFGQSRGSNTATILPNDPLFSKRYGRVILLRENIMRNDALFSNSRRGFDAVLDPRHHAELTAQGGFERTLWHEIGHYLGADRDVQGRTIDEALEEHADAYEEMKADLVSLFSAPALAAQNYYDDSVLRSVYASGIRRVLQSNQPRRDQPYQTMQLMQFNWFVDRGVLRWDPKREVLMIDYMRYPSAVRDLLARVLEIQSSGDKDAAARFMDEWTSWGPMHERIAAKMRESTRYRYNLIRYGALGE